MKWLFLVNNASYLSEFFGKLSDEIIKQGDDCMVVFSSKISEYEKNKFFPDNVKLISKIDWCIKNYKKEKSEFGGLSWKELFPAFDRFKSLNFSYNNSFNMISQVYQFVEFIFRYEKPDIVISEPPAGLFHKVAYYFCRINKVPYVGLGSSRFNDRIDIYDSEFTFSEYEKTFKETKEQNILQKEKEFAKDFIEKIVSHKHIPSYVGVAEIHFTQIGIAKHYIKKMKELKFLLKYVLNRKHFKNFDYESEANLKHVIAAFWKMEKRQLKIMFQKNIFSRIVSGDDKFFFFPLHYQPESSTSVWATYYSDQLNTVKNVAFTLPFPYKLYVKEHPASIGLRTDDFYEKLKKIPNVVLLSPEEQVENLIKKSSGIITLTSTAGMEAALVGKPVYILGNIFYYYHPLCRKVENFDELKKNIEDDLVSGVKVDNLENINYNFIASYFRNTIEGDIVSASSKKDNNNYKLIYEKLVKIFF